MKNVKEKDFFVKINIMKWKKVEKTFEGSESWQENGAIV